MVLSDRAGIRSDELGKVEASMIAASRIPRFLPLHVKEVDLQVTLWYDITEKKMLSHMLRSEKINMTEYYGLLLQVAEALEESAMYMLQPLKYVLDEDYIFVDGSLQEGTLYLTYIPLKRTEGLKPIKEGLKELVTRFMASVTELSGSGVQQLLQFTASDDFTPGGFKKLLLGLLSGEGDQASGGGSESVATSGQRDYRIQEPFRREDAGRLGREEHLAPSMGSLSRPQSGAVSRLQEKQARPLQAVEPRRERTEASAARNTVGSGAPPAGESYLPRLHDQGRNDDTYPDFLKSWGRKDQEAEVEKEDDEEKGKSASARKTYIALGCLLGAAIAWRMIYMADPGKGTLILCASLTVILGIVAAMSWMGKLFAPKQAEADSVPFEALPDFGSVELSVSKPRQGRSRFEVEQFTGFLRTGRKNREKGLGKPEEDPEPEWKWKFPSQDAADKNDNGIRHFGAGDVSEQTGSRGEPGLSRGERNLRHGERNLRHEEPALRRGERNHSQEPDVLSYPDTDEREYYGRLGLKTEILQPGGGATVLLNPPPASGGGHSVSIAAPPLGYLLREGEGGTGSERIELKQQHFVIGRSAEVSQYVESSVGTSRAHVELSRGDDGTFRIKDLGSKNGTRLRGEAMVPYKEYSLHDGDTFVIVKGHYTFRSA